MCNEFEVVLVPNFELKRRSGDRGSFSGCHWSKNRELDANVVPTDDQVALAAQRMPPGCDPDTVRQVAKGWKPVFRKDV